MEFNKTNVIKYDAIYLISFLMPFQPLLSKNIFLMTILCICGITMILLIQKNKKLLITDFNVGYIIFILLCLISVFYTKDIISTRVILISQIIPYCICCIVVCFYILSNPKYSYYRIVKFCKIFFISTLVICIIAILHDIKSFNIYTRIGKSLFENQYTMFTYYLMISSCIGIWLFSVEKIKIKKIFWIASIIFIYIIIISTAVRKALIVPIAFLLSYIFITAKSKKRLFKGIALVFTSIILIIFLYSLIMKHEYFASTAGRRIQSFMNGVQNKSGVDNSFNERKLLANSALQCFKSYPILGYGAGAFRDFAENTIGLRLYAHNNYLELLASLGILGCSIYYGTLFIILNRLFKFLRSNTNKVIVFSISFILSLLINDFAAVTYLSLPYMMILSIISCTYKCKILDIDKY